MKIGKYNVELTHEDKIIYPKAELTKKDLLEYYLYVADMMLPHLENRPLMLQRFPSGIKGEGFYQKDASDFFPKWIETTKIKKEGGTVNHVLCNDKATLAYLTNLATVSFHTWLSTSPEINSPDKFIIDLDPPSDDFSTVREAAFYVKELLDEINIVSFIMTTGSSGMHIVVPLDGKSDFDASRDFGKTIGDILIDKHAGLFTFERYKEKRKGKLYFDVQRNAYAQTGIAPYSLRPYQSAPIATPLAWDELKNKKLHSKSYHIKNIKQRLSKQENPWKGMKKHTISLVTAQQKLMELI